MDLERFHRNLLGLDATTPEIWQVRPTHQELYSSDRRGFLLPLDTSEQDRMDYLVATIVLALHDSTIPAKSTVHLILAPGIEKWAIEKISYIYRRMLAARKGFPVEQTRPVVSAMKRITTGTRPQALGRSPDRWVSYGFVVESTLPLWMQGQLIQILSQ